MKETLRKRVKHREDLEDNARKETKEEQDLQEIKSEQTKNDGDQEEKSRKRINRVDKGMNTHVEFDNLLTEAETMEEAITIFRKV